MWSRCAAGRRARQLSSASANCGTKGWFSSRKRGRVEQSLGYEASEVVHEKEDRPWPQPGRDNKDQVTASGHPRRFRGSNKRRAIELTKHLKRLGEARDVAGMLKLMNKVEADADAKASSMGRNSAGLMNVFHYSTCINYMGKASMWQECLAMLAHMEARGVEPNVFSYTSTAHACARLGMHEEALELMEKMRERGLKPNVVFYSSILQACVKGGRAQKAFQVLEEMREAGLKPNVISYTIIITGLAKQGAAEKALTVFDQMLSHGIKANVISYNAVISACAKAGKMTCALGLMSRMRSSNLHPNLVTYNSLLYACGRSGNAKKAVELLQQMKRYGPQPDSISYTCTIDACTRVGNFETALPLFREMKRTGMSPDKQLYHSAIKASRRAGKADMVLDLLKEMETQGFPKDDICRMWAFEAYLKLGEFNLATGELHDCRALARERKCERTYNSVVSWYCKAELYEEALDLLDEMHSLNMTPDTICFNSAIAACGRLGRVNTAMELLHKLESVGHPDLISYNTAIDACARAHQFDEAMALLDSAIQRGLQPDHVSFGAIIEACGRAGERTKAMQVYLKNMAFLGESHWSRKYEGTMDLHGYTMHKAFAAIEVVLGGMCGKNYEEHRHDPLRNLHIIIGHGQNSKHGSSVLGPGLEAMLGNLQPPIRLLRLRMADGWANRGWVYLPTRDI
ncbi:unnamed protein product, partial [Chrysoparadoxa australica]